MATQSLALAFGIGAVISLICLRLRIPAILPLLLAGFALGRSGLGLVNSADLGRALGAFISVSIGVLVFEGGLHLDTPTLKKVPRAVRGLLTRGALTTWGLTAMMAHWILDMEWPRRSTATASPAPRDASPTPTG
jgi:NhaP-type Na+/H+ or K+/H+ antiporter